MKSIKELNNNHNITTGFSKIIKDKAEGMYQEFEYICLTEVMCKII